MTFRSIAVNISLFLLTTYPGLNLLNAVLEVSYCSWLSATGGGGGGQGERPQTAFALP